MLICPHCQQPLVDEISRYRCRNNHCFDIGKAGDVNLLLPHQKRSKSPGDSKAMVAARHDFLRSGAYQPIAEWLANNVMTLSQGKASVIADAGCGEGYYLRSIYDHIFSDSMTPGRDITFCGWDISKFAVQRAAKLATFPSHWLTASNVAIPLSDNSVDVLISAFGFAVAAEFFRIIKPRGYLMTLDVGGHHLLELRQIIYPDLKPFREKPLLDKRYFHCQRQEMLSYQVEFNAVQLGQLMTMTPHLYRASYEGKSAIQSQTMLTTTIDVQLRLYQSK
ncbi:MAG: rRNA (guanine-N1)-methyltransferase [Gammaproteobacteria bacterium]|nr:MAG: rRNA (guanine-N1)-methyltransferase [Gammaproteobacteria bacterium]